MRARHDWFWFCFSLVEKVAQISGNHSQSAVKQNQSKREITFDTQLKTALMSLIVLCIQPDKPLMVAEFWPGWFDHWSELHHRMEVDKVVKRVSNILKAGASINFYMFHGKVPYD